MPKIVEPSDFTDKELAEFVGSIERLTYSVRPDAPKWVAAEAAAFADSNPKPSHDELRLHIGNAVRIAMGWDDPDNPRVMLHAALKAFYLSSWLDRIAKAKHTDLAPALRATFTPNFRH